MTKKQQLYKCPSCGEQKSGLKGQKCSRCLLTMVFHPKPGVVVEIPPIIGFDVKLKTTSCDDCHSVSFTVVLDKKANKWVVECDECHAIFPCSLLRGRDVDEKVLQ